MVETVEQFTGLLEYALSRPPSAAGRKVKSYRELSKDFNVSHSLVKTSLSQLEKKGLIFRKHGSGTYVRRVPNETRFRFSSSQADKNIFKDDLEDSPIISAPAKYSQAKLNLGIIGVVKSNAVLTNFVMQAIGGEISQRGHSLSVHYIDQERTDAENLKRLETFINNSSCEGYLVNGQYAADELEFIKKQNVPTLYFIVGRLLVKHEPIIMMDGADAVERAIVKLIEQGYKKIALLGLGSPSRMYDRYESHIYQRTMEQHSIGYRRIELVSPRNFDFKNSAIAMENLLNDSNKPEAVVIADDNLMPGVVGTLENTGIKPGRDLGIIALSNKGIPLPNGYNWSRFEFNPEYFGKALVDNLLWMMQRADSEMENLNILARWQEGDTHLRTL